MGKTGKGRYIFQQGAEYVGGFNGGVQEGDGDFQTKDTEQPWEYFKGQYHEGQKTNGEYKMTNGDLYSGHFSPAGGRYDGSGRYVWTCGKVYDGHFKDGLPDGQGIMTSPQGWTYTGQFVQGKFEGQGTFTWPGDGSNYYEGTFSQGEMTGEGAYYLADGGLYEGGRFYPNRQNRDTFFQACLMEKPSGSRNLPVILRVPRGRVSMGSSEVHHISEWLLHI